MPGSVAGNLLISRLYLPDPNFRESVVLIIEHNDEGAFGLVINNQLALSVADIFPELTSPLLKEAPVFLGGPVQSEVITAIHGGGGIDGGTEIVPGVFFQPSYDEILPYFAAEDINIRNIKTILGYSGWGPGQLEKEMAEETWLVVPATKDLIFSSKGEEGWRSAIGSKGGLYRAFAEKSFHPENN